VDLSEDPADLFVQLYDRLGDDPFLDGSAADWYEDPLLREHAFEVQRQVLATGRVARALVGKLAVTERGKFALLWGLELALAEIDPFTGRAEGTQGREMMRLAMRYASHARLNTDPDDGALLYVRAFAGRPLGIPAKAQFFRLIRVPASACEGVDHAWLPANHGFFSLESAPGGDIPIGCPPIAETLEELVIEPTERHGRRRYRIGPRPEALRKRVRDTLKALDESGAVIAVLPEATLCDELVKEWRAAMKERRRAATSLRWLVLGTGPVGGAEPPHNRAVVLDRLNGQELLTYDKHADFTLTASQVREWGLEPYLGPGGAVEDITKGKKLLLRESDLGRIAILVCEDLGRTTEIAAHLAEFGVSHVFAPIFSAPFSGAHGWADRPAREYVFDLGAWVVVANSLAVYAAVLSNDAASERLKEAAESAPTCFAVGPADDHRDSYVFNPEAKRANAGDDVQILHVSAGMARRHVDFL
jgi:predicted amidohydrolase